MNISFTAVNDRNRKLTEQNKQCKNANKWGRNINR